MFFWDIEGTPNWDAVEREISRKAVVKPLHLDRPTPAVIDFLLSQNAKLSKAKRDGLWYGPHQWHFEVVSPPFQAISFPDYSFDLTVDTGDSRRLIVKPSPEIGPRLAHDAIQQAWEVTIPRAPLLRSGAARANVRLTLPDGQLENRSVIVHAQLAEPMLELARVTRLELDETVVKKFSVSGGTIDIGMATMPTLFIPCSSLDISSRPGTVIHCYSKGKGPFLFAGVDSIDDSKVTLSDKCKWRRCDPSSRKRFQEANPTLDEKTLASLTESYPYFWMMIRPESETLSTVLMLGDGEVLIWRFDERTRGFASVPVPDKLIIMRASKQHSISDAWNQAQMEFEADSKR